MKVSPFIKRYTEKVKVIELGMPIEFVNSSNLQSNLHLKDRTVVVCILKCKHSITFESVMLVYKVKIKK